MHLGAELSNLGWMEGTQCAGLRAYWARVRACLLGPRATAYSARAQARTCAACAQARLWGW